MVIVEHGTHGLTADEYDKAFRSWFFAHGQNGHTETPCQIVQQFNQLTINQFNVEAEFRQFLWRQISARDPIVMEELQQLTEDTVIIGQTYGRIIARAWYHLKETEPEALQHEIPSV